MPRKTPYVDLTGRRFGKLTVKEYVPRKGWRCVCNCKHKRECIRTTRRLLHDAKNHSCGCSRFTLKYEKEAARKRA